MTMLEDISRNLFRLLVGQKCVYATTEPDLPDFSVHRSGVLRISTPNGDMQIPFDRDNIIDLWGILRISVFGGEYAVISYGIHPLFSYALFYTKELPGAIPAFYDLKIIEKFCGLAAAPPASYQEAIDRLNALKADKCWVRPWKLVYQPLVTRVLPDIETTGLVHVPTKSAVYTHYEVEYQSQGRMQSFALEKGFNAHTIGQSADYKPRGDEMVFLMMDFSAMEVHVLAHLSQCPALRSIIDSGEDVYRGIYKRIFNKDCPSDERRKFVKETFLAVVFGMGAAGMAKSKNIEHKSAAAIIAKYYESFPVAFNYIIDQVPLTATTVRDALGRPRWHDANDYKARNFVIQASSSTICLERLVALHGAIDGKAKLAMHIHDGYAIVCHKAAFLDIYELSKSVLESESVLVPGLKLRADGKVGPSLNLLAKP